MSAGAYNVIDPSLKTAVWQIEDIPEHNDQFGRALDTGDLNNDHTENLVIGIPYEDVHGRADARAASVIYGTANGLSTADDQLFTQDPLAGGLAESFDYFGHALAMGDFDNEGYDDLAASELGATVAGAAGAGIVHVIPGSYYYGLIRLQNNTESIW